MTHPGPERRLMTVRVLAVVIGFGGSLLLLRAEAAAAPAGGASEERGVRRASERIKALLLVA